MINNIPNEVLKIIFDYLEFKDSYNLSLINKKSYVVYDDYINSKHQNPLLNEYYNLRIISNETRSFFNTKSYMFHNSINIFRDKYFFLCKIYLDEIYNCNYFPKDKKGYLKFYKGIYKLDKNIYSAKIEYKNKNIKEDKNLKFMYNRKYILISRFKTLPLSDIRELYIKKNIDNLIENHNNNILSRNEIFSKKYLFGPPTYFECNPIDEIKLYENKKYNKIHDDWIVIATFDPDIILPNDEITNEMISFVIRKKHLKEMKFDKVYIIYNNVKK